MRKAIIILAVAFTMIFSQGCQSKENVTTPDAVSSYSTNNDTHLTIVANQEVTDKEAFAKELLTMCKENSFTTIKFSTDMGNLTSVSMNVYQDKDSIEGNDPIMRVEYKPIEYGKDYNIVDDPDKFELYVDDELI